MEESTAPMEAYEAAGAEAGAEGGEGVSAPPLLSLRLLELLR